MLTRVALCSCLGLAACATAPRREPSLSSAPAATVVEPGAVVAADEASDPVAPPAAPERVKTLRPAQLASELEPTYLGVIDRSGLVVILDQGLGHVLARLKLSPVLVQGKFHGFRVTEIDPAWAAAGLAISDVVLRLNGRPIERPEQAMVAFESLRVASELALELSRGGHKLTLRYRIEASAPTSSASAPP